MLPLGDASALALYSEYDEHAWDSDTLIAASGSWLPTEQELANAVWSDSLNWEVKDSDFLLLNSAASGAGSLREDDFCSVQLPIGNYIVEYAAIESQSKGLGSFYKFTFKHAQ